jgi:MFS family permease
MTAKPPVRLPWRFWIVALVAFINAVSFTIVIPILYPYAKQFGLTDFQASLLTTAYAAAQFVGTPILGRLSDRLGRKPLLILSLLGTVAANALASFTPLPGLLFAARILDGITGGNNSIAQAIISDITEAGPAHQSLWHFWRSVSPWICGRSALGLRCPTSTTPARYLQFGHGLLICSGDRPRRYPLLLAVPARDSPRRGGLSTHLG